MIGCIVLLAQFQPNKNGEYVRNFMVNDWINSFIRKSYIQILASIIWYYLKMKQFYC